MTNTEQKIGQTIAELIPKLTEEEKEEQARLRQEYVAAIRGSLRNNLNNISIKEPDGSITDLGKKHGGIKEV